MLRAIADELRGRHLAAVEPRIGSYDERARIGLLQKFSNRLPDPLIRAGARTLPKKARWHLLDKYGIVFDDGIEAVLDASGFAYSDQFDLQRCVLAADRAERFRRQGKPFVLLPQAFGPFTSAALREAFVRLADNSDLVYAREQVSYEHVISTGCRTDHVRLAPDFTCLLAGEVPGEFDRSERLALLVPSEKLLSQTSSVVREAYLPFLAAAVEWFRREAYDVRMLLHERDDGGIINELQDHLDHTAPVIHFSDARHLKGIIGSAHIVVGSRFHALVSALSQGIPAIGVGWSHKYAMLFDDYDCEEHVVDPTIGAEALSEHLATLSYGSHRDRVVRGLQAAAETERQRAGAMWLQVHALLSAADR
jgi:colanic acid/amylovoran biosynthesis protein